MIYKLNTIYILYCSFAYSQTPIGIEHETVSCSRSRILVYVAEETESSQDEYNLLL